MAAIELLVEVGEVEELRADAGKFLPLETTSACRARSSNKRVIARHRPGSSMQCPSSSPHGGIGHLVVVLKKCNEARRGQTPCRRAPALPCQ
jgi:hypothetical protein